MSNILHTNENFNSELNLKPLELNLKPNPNWKHAARNDEGMINDESIKRRFQLSSGSMVDHPNHYNAGKYECIDVMVETFGLDSTKEWCIMNAFKYLYRYKHKNGKEDISKAKWYLDWVADHE